MRDRATASAFADWVFRLTAPELSLRENTERLSRMAIGQLSHETIQLRYQTSWWRRHVGDMKFEEYELVYSDNDSRFPSTRGFVASSLVVDNRLLVGKPDLVLRNVVTLDLIIVERKTTFVPRDRVPLRGWPNAEAQLWCYSKIDLWKNAPKIKLISEIWHHIGRRPNQSTRNQWLGDFYRESEVEQLGLEMSISVLWLAGDTQHEEQCSALFKQYGGRILSQTD